MPTPRLVAALVSTVALGVTLVMPWGAQAAAPTPVADVVPAAAPQGDPWVVSLGDSFISGEAGRWAGNESGTTSDIDALGRAAYWDARDREAIERCHRSRSAAIHIGVVKSLNLACSGAITSTKFDSDGNFKPGIDFYRDGNRKGQALMLQEFAEQNKVRMVALSIGGNDFRFSSIIEQCVKDFLVPLASPKCKNDDKVNSFISASAQDRVRKDTATAILNIATAMENAGYDDADWTLVLQLYPQPLPGSSNMRYTEYGYERQRDGGCGFRDADLDWAATTLLPIVNDTFRGAGRDAQAQRPSMQVAVMDSSKAFSQRQLCHDEVWRIQEGRWSGNQKGPDSWQAAGAVDQSEWVMEINLVNLRETYQQESLHPNYWGQLALRNCWRQVWNDGDVRGGVCERDRAASGLTADCEPRMTLTPSGRAAARAASPREGASVTLRCPGISVDQGQTAVLRGRVTGAGPDTRVTLQAKWDGRAWRDEATVRPDPEGDYRFTVTVPASVEVGRVYQWRAVVTSGGDVVAVSQTRSTLVR